MNLICIRRTLAFGPLIAVAGGRARELVRRETVADLMARDLGWAGRDGGRPETSGK